MPGLRGLAALTVTDADPAVALRSGEVPTLATPLLVALLEEATVSALDGCLGKGEPSVGMRVHIDHLAPSAPASLVDAEVVLEAVEGRRLAFAGMARVSDDVVARATIVRVVVETDRFLDRVTGGTG